MLRDDTEMNSRLRRCAMSLLPVALCRRSESDVGDWTKRFLDRLVQRLEHLWSTSDEESDSQDDVYHVTVDLGVQEDASTTSAVSRASDRIIFFSDDEYLVKRILFVCCLTLTYFFL